MVIEEVLVFFGGYHALVVCTRGVRDGLLLRETFNGRVVEMDSNAASSTVSCPGWRLTAACWRKRRIQRAAAGAGEFLSIFSANLDEFFMVRVATLKRRLLHAGEKAAPGRHGDCPAEKMPWPAASAALHELVDEQHRLSLQELQPLLAAEGVPSGAARRS